jgi:hypothetical protein
MYYIYIYIYISLPDFGKSDIKIWGLSKVDSDYQQSTLMLGGSEFLQTYVQELRV